MLNPYEKQKVKYCIPTEIRDEQIKLSLKKIKKRVLPGLEINDEPIAIVGFGPSLKYTWENLKNFKTIFTCSGSHKFLIERNIIPTYHIECDPRKHKVDLLGKPNQNVKYLIASCCHPKYFEHLDGFDVSIWHVFHEEHESQRIIPRGEWCMTGGSSVGLRSISMARFLGFTNLHIFGMDGSFDSENSHADVHPKSTVQYKELCELNGKEFYTIPSVLECARQTFHELDQLPDVKFKFYGEGLIQEMSKNYVRKENKNEIALGFRRPKLLSDEYLELVKQTFEDYPEYGIGGHKHKNNILELYESIDGKSILDYGCGRGYLGISLDFPIWEYDPAITGKDNIPRPADLVVCTDVLEHIEPDRIEFVLDDIRRCTKKIAYLSISTRPAIKRLRDGRNAHLIIENSQWWKNTIEKYFFINNEYSDDIKGYYNCVVIPKIELTGYKVKHD